MFVGIKTNLKRDVLVKQKKERKIVCGGYTAPMKNHYKNGWLKSTLRIIVAVRVGTLS